MDPETDLAAFEAWLIIDGEIAKLAGFARERMGVGAASQLDKVRGSLAVEAQMHQEGAFEARMRQKPNPSA